jgi:aspartate-semialdehyde dehydrogenase
MTGRVLRGAVVGASSLLGKELAEELNDSAAAWDLVLLDTAEAGGQITSAGDEALMIQPVSAEAFAGMDVVFFAGEAATAREFWKAAHAKGAGIVDLTGALEGEAGVVVRSGGEEGETPVNLTTVAVVSMHPMAAVLRLMRMRLNTLGLKRLAATVLLPASEMGSAGVDELHQQTAGLLTFKPLQKNVYDAQVAFNLQASLGSESKIDPDRERAKILRQAGGEADVLTLQVVQAPVFHGFAASVFVEMNDVVRKEPLHKVLRSGVLHFAEDLAPSNNSVAGTAEVSLSLQVAESGEASSFWIWLAGDNLRLAAKNASLCALELAALRPVLGVN